MSDVVYILVFSLTFLLIVKRHGLISVHTLILCTVSYPLLTPIYLHLQGADYFSFMNKEIQRSEIIAEKANKFSLIFWISFLSLVVTQKKSITPNNVVSEKFSQLYLIFIPPCVYLFSWLTEPTFKIIGLYTYNEILESRLGGANFAGALLLLTWALYVLTVHKPLVFLRRNKELNIKILYSNFVVYAPMLWLALHARRSELVAMAIILLILSNLKMYKKYMITIFVFVSLFIIERVRDTLLAEANFSGIVAGVAALPGGAGNIYLTLLTTIDFFESNSLFLGETFFNYLLQLWPSFIFELGINRPDYYYQMVLENYQYNGGTFIGAIFYANFGLFGGFLLALFARYYITLINVLFGSSNQALRAFALFYLGFSLRAFWYEPIVVIKPLVILMLPLVFIVSTMRK